MFFSSWYSVLFVLLSQGDISVSYNWEKLPQRYALIKPEKTGCPKGWDECEYREKDIHRHDKSESLHMAGYVDSKTFTRYFCISRLSTITGFSTWPEGKYCIYSKHSMKGMGYDAWRRLGIRTDHVDSLCADSFVEDGHNYKYLNFRCQTSGNKKIPIELPITKPFYLLPYGSRDCQQVKWMVATSEWIKYHAKYYYTLEGHLPYHKPVYYRTNRLTMYYCYYQSCNQTLNKTKGIFESPRFHGKYPNGQLCAWRIMVPANHTVTVHVTNFSLYGYDKDCLQLYENNSDIFEPKQAFFGHQKPFNITASSDLLFVFRSDEENNGPGFKAQYEIFKIPERTTTASPKPSTTTAPPTTQKPTTTTRPTTKPITTKPPTTKPPTTKVPTTKQVTTKKATAFTQNSTTSQGTPNTTNYESSRDRNVQTCIKETSFCDETWKTVVMVLPLVFFILIVVVVVDLFYRCRSRKSSKSGTSESVDDGIVINPTYERGDIVIDHAIDTATENSTANSVDDKSLSHDELPDYEDVDYTQLNEMNPPNMTTRYPECHALEPVGHDGPELFYHVLEPPTDLNRPTYQNLTEMNHYTMNPLYDSSAQNPAPLVEENKLYVQYSAS